VTFVALLALLAAAEVDVHSSTHCPSTEDVLAHLAPLLPARSEAAQSAGHDLANIEIAAIAPDGTFELRIELTGKDGAPIGERRVPGRGSCSDKAEAVAAVLAAWETDPSPAMPTTEPTPTEAPASATDVSKGPPNQTTSPRLNVAVGAGGGIALVGGLASAATVSVTAGPTDSHWQLRIDGAVERDRRIDLDAGYVDWHHSTAGMAIGFGTLSPRLVFAADLGAVAGWASLAGNRFDNNRTRTAFEYGLAAGARLGRAWGRWQLWMELRPRLWLHGQQAVLTKPPAGQTTTADIPVWDVLVCAGASVAVLR
jgi:hypothetical protein